MEAFYSIQTEPELFTFLSEFLDHNTVPSHLQSFITVLIYQGEQFILHSQDGNRLNIWFPLNQSTYSVNKGSWPVLGTWIEMQAHSVEKKFEALYDSIPPIPGFQKRKNIKKQSQSEKAKLLIPVLNRLAPSDLSFAIQVKPGDRDFPRQEGRFLHHVARQTLDKMPDVLDSISSETKEAIKKRNFQYVFCLDEPEALTSQQTNLLSFYLEKVLNLYSHFKVNGYETVLLTEVLLPCHRFDYSCKDGLADAILYSQNILNLFDLKTGKNSRLSDRQQMDLYMQTALKFCYPKTTKAIAHLIYARNRMVERKEWVLENGKWISKDGWKKEH